MTDTMRAARLHGVDDLRIETLGVLRPGARDLLVRDFVQLVHGAAAPAS
jgi:hypothetical protein